MTRLLSNCLLLFSITFYETNNWTKDKFNKIGLKQVYSKETTFTENECFLGNDNNYTFFILFPFNESNCNQMIIQLNNTFYKKCHKNFNLPQNKINIIGTTLKQWHTFNYSFIYKSILPLNCMWSHSHKLFSYISSFLHSLLV